MYQSKLSYIFLCFLFFSVSKSFSQDTGDIIIKDSIAYIDEGIDPLSPSRAAFYSAILPGLGQAYNKKYWKIPIIYAALGVSISAVIYNNDQYNRTRDAYKLLKAGKPHEFDGTEGFELSEETLERIQISYKEDRDLAVLITIGIYALQIVEASVNAHLLQLNTIDNITFNPTFHIDPVSNKSVAGVSISFDF